MKYMRQRSPAMQRPSWHRRYTWRYVPPTFNLASGPLGLCGFCKMSDLHAALSTVTRLCWRRNLCMTDKVSFKTYVMVDVWLAGRHVWCLCIPRIGLHSLLVSVSRLNPSGLIILIKVLTPTYFATHHCAKKCPKQAIQFPTIDLPDLHFHTYEGIKR